MLTDINSWRYKQWIEHRVLEAGLCLRLKRVQLNRERLPGVLVLTLLKAEKPFGAVQPELSTVLALSQELKEIGIGERLTFIKN